jgi:hypothetical protein
MFWNSVWCENHNYVTSFKEDVLIRKFISLIVKDKISKNFFRLKKKTFFSKKFSNLKKKYKYNFVFSNRIFLRKLFKTFKIPIYASKVFVIRLNSWVLIYFNIVSPKKGVNYTNTQPNLYFLKKNNYIVDKKLNFFL